MKELQEILQAFEAIKQAEGKAVLATIVKVKGSTYRRPGARMLIRQDGSTVGAISSGCLEADVAERAKKVMESNEAVTVVYDMTSSEEDVWGLNLGCNGIIHLLLEPIPFTVGSPHFKFLSDCMQHQRAGVVTTVFRVDGEMKAKVGSRLLLHEDGSVSEDIRNPSLSSALLEDSLAALRSRQSGVKEYRFTEGVVEAFIEVIRPPVPLLIFGAGTDSIPVARLAKELGWNVTLVDHRPALATKDRFPNLDAFILARPEEVAEKVTLKAHHVAAVLTHNFSYDLQLLRTLLPSPVRYIGLLGPSKRTGLLLEKLRETGFTPSPRQVARLHNPIGLNIGAESPEEISLSIISEIQAFVAGRSGGFLRDHGGPIHSL
jgi:xanthine dehydrogenase accessory factor